MDRFHCNGTDRFLRISRERYEMRSPAICIKRVVQNVDFYNIAKYIFKSVRT